MPAQDRLAFIADPKPDMTTREKNEHLAARLALAPHVTRLLVSIQRIEIGDQGWRITYRVPS